MTGQFFVLLYEVKSRSVLVQAAGVVVQIHYALKQVAVKSKEWE
jgi:hypothetical protein